MKLSIKEVEHIAWLARLDLTEEEKQLYAEQLSEILDYAARLDDIDTTHILPTASVLIESQPLREDEPRPGLSRDDLLKNAPETRDGQFKVPPVLGN